MHLSIIDISASKNVCRFWYRIALLVVNRLYLSYLPNELVNLGCSPMIMAFRISLLQQQKHLSNIYSLQSRKIFPLNSLSESKWLQHIVCYPYKDATLNAKAQKIFMKRKLASRTSKFSFYLNNYDIILRIVTGNLLSDNATDKGLLRGLEEHCFASNNRRIIGYCLDLGAELRSEQYRNNMPLQPLPQHQVWHKGHEQLVLSAIYRCEMRVFDLIISRYSWDKAILLKIIFTRVIPVQYLCSVNSANLICVEWPLVLEITKSSQSLLIYDDGSYIHQYDIIYALLLSGNITLISAVFHNLLDHNMLTTCPDAMLGGFLVAFSKFGLVENIEIIREICNDSASANCDTINRITLARLSKDSFDQSSNINTCSNTDDVMVLNNSPIFKNPVYTIVSHPTNNRWSALLRVYADAVFDCILQADNSALYYLVLEIIRLSNDKIINYFAEACFARNEAMLSLLALSVHLEAAVLPHKYRNYGSDPLRVLQRLACTFASNTLAIRLYNYGMPRIRPECHDIDIALSMGSLSLISYFLETNPTLNIDQYHLFVAISYGQLEALIYLLDNYSHIHLDEGCVMLAAFTYQPHILKCIFDRLPDLVPLKKILYPRNDGSAMKLMRIVGHYDVNTRLDLFNSESWFIRQDIVELIQIYQSKIKSLECSEVNEQQSANVGMLL